MQIMNWLLLSNKKSFAPLIYITFQLGLLLPSIYINPSIIDIPNNHEMLIFWIDVIIVFFLYFICHFKDPGYVPYDAVFFTEQEQSCRSETKLKPLVRGNNANHIKIDISNMEKSTNDRKLGLSEIQTPNGYAYQDDKIQNPPDKPIKRRNTAPLSHDLTLLKKENQEFERRNEVYINQNPNKYQNFQDDIDPSIPNEELIPECEPSVDIEARNDIDTNADEVLSSKTGDDLNKLDDNDNEDGTDKVYIDYCCYKTNQNNNHNDTNNNNHNHHKRNNKQDDTNTKNILSTANQVTKDTDNNKVQNQITSHHNLASINNHQRDHNNNNKQNINLIPWTLNTSSFNRHLTDEDKGKSMKIGDTMSEPGSYLPLDDDDEGITTKNNIVRTNNKNKMISSVLIIQQQQHQMTTSTKTEIINAITTEKQLSYLSPFKTNELVKNTLYRDNINNNNNNNNNNTRSNTKIESVKPDLNLSPEEFSNQKNKEEDGDILFIERRYCTICNIDQPIRSKHCKHCKRCCASYDHHCPWLGTCIGEKNHLIFYWFLVFQFIEAIWGVLEMAFNIVGFEEDKEIDIIVQVGQIVIICTGSFFIIMVGLLLAYHSYLISINMTTWENMSWDKISYLKEWPKKNGSPFSEGCFNNIKYFCCNTGTTLKHWKLPKIKKTV